MYKIEQVEVKKRSFCGFKLSPKKIKKSYYFKQYKNVLRFALNEQINIFYCIVSDKVTTKRKPFKQFLSLTEFKKVSKKNPLFYLSANSYKGINLEKYYFYLVNSDQLQKLKKF